MNEKTIKALVDAGAIKRACIIAEGARFHVEVDTKTGSITASTLNGRVVRDHRNIESWVWRKYLTYDVKNGQYTA